MHLLCTFGMHDIRYECLYRDGSTGLYAVCTRCDYARRLPGNHSPDPPVEREPAPALPPLPTFGRNNTCPKCAETGATTEYCHGAKLLPVLKTFRGVVIESMQAIDCYDGQEHFHRKCQVCGYTWKEALPRQLKEEPR